MNTFKIILEHISETADEATTVEELAALGILLDKIKQDKRFEELYLNIMNSMKLDYTIYDIDSKLVNMLASTN